jgi:hypothetical protein
MCDFNTVKDNFIKDKKNIWGYKLKKSFVKFKNIELINNFFIIECISHLWYTYWLNSLNWI